MDDDTRTPTPDPTVLTTEALLRAVGGERDYVDGQIGILKQRLDAMDEATRVLHETVTRIPTDVQREVGHIRELVDEKFLSVKVQFAERDTRSERESRDNKVAVDAAFAAQKEAAAKQDESNLKAIDKSERATAETIKTLSELFQTTVKALSDKNDDLKNRVQILESEKRGAGEARASLGNTATLVIGALGLLVAALGLAIVVILANA
jgi:cation transport regulator ChaB